MLLDFNKNNKTGQGSLETFVFLAVLILIVKGGLMLFWLLAGQLWLDHQLYQHLICRAKGRSEILCTKKLLKEVKKFTRIGSIKDIESIHFDNNWRGSLNWNMGGISLPVRQTLKLP